MQVGYIFSLNWLIYYIPYVFAYAVKLIIIFFYPI